MISDWPKKWLHLFKYLQHSNVYFLIFSIIGKPIATLLKYPEKSIFEYFICAVSISDFAETIFSNRVSSISASFWLNSPSYTLFFVSFCFDSIHFPSSLQSHCFIFIFCLFYGFSFLFSGIFSNHVIIIFFHNFLFKKRMFSLSFSSYLRYIYWSNRKRKQRNTRQSERRKQYGS